MDESHLRVKILVMYMIVEVVRLESFLTTVAFQITRLL